MFPSFTGSSRKPRQVNLSGRRSTPQPKQIPGLSTQTHQHSSALLLAQQQRARREAERRELEAAKKIQSTWRGKQELSKRRAIWRNAWDNKYGRELASRGVRDMEEATNAIRLFLGFYGRTWSTKKAIRRTGPRQPGEDLQRLAILVKALSSGRDSMSNAQSTSEIEFQDFFTLHRFFAILLSTISQLPPDLPNSLELVVVALRLITELPIVALSVVEGQSFSFSTSQIISPTYFKTLSLVTTSFHAYQNPELQRLLLDCLTGPFCATSATSLQSYLPTRAATYKAITRYYLTTPNLKECLGLGTLEALSSTLRMRELSSAIMDLSSDEDAQVHRSSFYSSRRSEQKDMNSNKPPEDSKLWLLAHIIFLCRVGSREGTFRNSQDRNNYIRCITTLLDEEAREIGSRVDVEDQEMSGSGTAADPMRVSEYEDEPGLDAEGNSLRKKAPLPGFIKEQLYTLIDQSSISSLLSETSSYTQGGQSSGTSREVEAQLLASYALTLLLVFPKKREELRMWLYLASTADGVPAIRYLWETAKWTNLYTAVSTDVSAAVDILKKKRKVQNTSEPNIWRTRTEVSSHQRQYQEYQGVHIARTDVEETGNDVNNLRVILLFLELYSFLLLVMDDEDFFNAGKYTLAGSGEGSRTRDSAPALKDVKDLTIFLKNLAFAMYWYAGEIMSEGQKFDGENGFISGGMGNLDTTSDDPSSASVKGMDFNFVKGLVTNLLRMIYLRE